MHIGVEATILVVDDNASNRVLASNTLEDEGYRVLVACDGVEALFAIENSPPDCILLDVRMAGLDGFEVCRRVRATPLGADIPIIFLTALRDVDTFDRAFQAGGDDFITKPFRPTEIASRVKIALELRRLNIEVRDHCDQLRRQRNDLLRLQLQKERMSTFVVHDLKNPLSAIDLHAQLLMSMTELPLQARESAAHIHAGALQMTRLILNLLDVSKSDEGRLVPNCATCDLRRVVRDLLSELEVHGTRHKIQLQSNIEATTLYADEVLVRRVLINLVENAIRYAPENTPVTITATRHGRTTQISVSDAGGGVAPELRDKIFDPFVQLDGNGSDDDRRGLGLSFCKVVVEAHGGSIWVEDAAPGARFCMRLPDAATPSIEASGT
jgi:two-component system, sensor histidine kinase and response regulator